MSMTGTIVSLILHLLLEQRSSVCEVFANLHPWATPPEVHQSCQSQGDWGWRSTPMPDH
jgi:hypothetical protein